MLRNLAIIGSVIACLFGFSDEPKRAVIFTKKAPAPIGPYSQAIRSWSTVYVSGQIALRTDGRIDTSSIENECRQVLENIKVILEAGGKRLEDVCKTTIYVRDLNHFARINAVYQQYFQNDPPARETVEVSALPKGAHVEISAIAD